MAESEFLKGVMELYQGEVLGEVFFSEWLHTAEDDDQRYKIATMMQLEGETKIRLRPWLFRLGLDTAESPQARADGLRAAQGTAAMNWQEKMTMLHQMTRDRFVPRYKEIAGIAPSEDREWALSMVDHEEALCEMARREASGMADRSDEPVVAQLKHPLPRPRR